MPTGFVSDRRYLKHDTGPDHPERPSRLLAIERAVRKSPIASQLVRLRPSPADPDDVLAVHAPEYLARIESACRAGAHHVDSPDSAVSKESYEIALLAAGGVITACDAVMAGKVENAFCAVRPPGHHAEPDRAMGFCFLNNVAIAARRLQRRHGLERILIIDWDVHHGNGTQHIFERDGSVMFCSLHEHPGFCYPGTGWSWECGEGRGLGRIINLPMPPHSTDADYVAAFNQRIAPAARKFQPQFVLVSAGFDAHEADPLAGIELTKAGFDWLARSSRQLALDCSAGRFVSVLEGGYNFDVLGECVVSHLEILMTPPDRLAAGGGVAQPR